MMRIISRQSWAQINFWFVLVTVQLCETIKLAFIHSFTPKTRKGREKKNCGVVKTLERYYFQFNFRFFVLNIHKSNVCPFIQRLHWAEYKRGTAFLSWTRLSWKNVHRKSNEAPTPTHCWNAFLNMKHLRTISYLKKNTSSMFWYHFLETRIQRNTNNITLAYWVFHFVSIFQLIGKLLKHWNMYKAVANQTWNYMHTNYNVIIYTWFEWKTIFKQTQMTKLRVSTSWVKRYCRRTVNTCEYMENWSLFMFVNLFLKKDIQE